MTDADDGFRHSQVEVRGSSIHVVEAGDPQADPVLFLHGWPQSWRTWRAVMRHAAPHVHAVAIDLPGIGESTGDATDGSKHRVAETVREVTEFMGLGNLTVVGHDAGAMVAYAYLRSVPDLKAAVIMDVAVAGVAPWEQLVSSSQYWHFVFHAIPSLPERLIQHRQRDYFDFFYDAFSSDPSKITDGNRRAYVDAYSSDAALTAGFNWYRTFSRDAEHNEQTGQGGDHTDTPTLLLLSGPSGPQAESFLDGFHAAGLTNVEHAVVDNAGHFMQEEAPEQTWNLIATFLGHQPVP